METRHSFGFNLHCHQHLDRKVVQASHYPRETSAHAEFAERPATVAGGGPRRRIGSERCSMFSRMDLF